MAWIAIDAGTTIIKAVALGLDGKELALARVRTSVVRLHPGYSEQSMEDVWKAVCSAIQQVVQRCNEPIEGFTSTAQGDGCWLVDAELRPVRNAILWNDGRASAIVERWREAGLLEAAFRISGSVCYPGLSNAILAWMQDNEPAILARARWMLSCNGWIFARLTGQVGADLSDASNPFCNVQDKTYSREIVQSFSLQEMQRLLPPISRGHELSASLLPDVAEELGVSVGLPVVMAPYDIVTTALGCGVSCPGQACVILGTTICTETITDSLSLNEDIAGTTIALENGQYLRAMPTLTGCEAQEWAANLLTHGDLDQLQQLASRATPSLRLPLFLPYLSSAGERAPFLAPDARGSFHALSLSTASSQMAHAIYEGLSFVIRECLSAATPHFVHEIRVAGGGARNDFWCQMIADVTGIEVIRVEGNEHGARGAILFALAVASQIETAWQGLNSFMKKERSFVPNPENEKIYSTRYPLWLALRETASAQWQLLKEVQ